MLIIFNVFIKLVINIKMTTLIYYELVFVAYELRRCDKGNGFLVQDCIA